LLPEKTGNRNKQVFELARALKSYPQYAGAKAVDLLPIVKEWLNEGVKRGVIATVPFDETASDFITAWPTVKFPKGEGVLNEIIKRAKANPLPEVTKDFDSESLRFLVAVCRELQREAGDGVFFLSCRIGAKIVNKSHMTVSSFFKYLEVLKVIEYVGKAKQGGKRAQRFRYLGD
jgi:hypothetical protein